MSRQIASSILMIRPVSFEMNTETAINNYYQKVVDGLTPEKAQEQALNEFDAYADKLKENGIDVVVIEDTHDPETPDSIFPNNWISFHHDGTIALYPMFAENRREERREDISELMKEKGFEVVQIKDFTAFENQGKNLEGTGSMLLDRDNHIVYAALSARTDKEVLDVFCEEFSYSPITFKANQTVDGARLPIYHTNVMMCLTDKLAVVCLDSIDDEAERTELVESLVTTGMQILEISEDQVNQFAGNMLAVRNKDAEEFLVMSAAALQSLKDEQIKNIESNYKIISSSLDTIEALGGGSARCMMAEVFLPKSKEN